MSGPTTIEYRRALVDDLNDDDQSPVPQRIASGLIDFGVYLGLQFAAFLQVFLGPLHRNFDITDWIVLFAPLTLVILLEAATGRSAGKWHFRWRLVTVGGNRPSHSRLLARALIKYAFAIDLFGSMFLPPDSAPQMIAVCGFYPVLVTTAVCFLAVTSDWRRTTYDRWLGLRFARHA